MPKWPILISCCIPLTMSTLSPLVAQVVQLPAYRTFGYTGSAWVPDQGTGTLAGNYSSRGYLSSRGSGPYGGRTSGAQLGGSSLSASATIIDLQALDDAILEANVPRDPDQPSPLSANSPAAGGGRRYLTTTEPYLLDKGIEPRDRNAYRRALAGHNPSVRQAATMSQVESDIRFYLENGKKAEQAGRILAARVYYRMALEAMTPEMIERYHRILEEREEAEEDRKEANRPDRIQF